MNAFHYKSLPLDVYFDNGKSKEIKEILTQHGYQKVLVLTTLSRKTQAKSWQNNLQILPWAYIHMQ